MYGRRQPACDVAWLHRVGLSRPGAKVSRLVGLPFGLVHVHIHINIMYAIVIDHLRGMAESRIVCHP